MEIEERKVLYTAADGKITVYENGYWEDKSDGFEMGGNVHSYRAIISAQFNQLKAKIYNALEASALSDRQLEAIKGLLKGFCNEHYHYTVGDMAGLLQNMGLVSKREGCSFGGLEE